MIRRERGVDRVLTPDLFTEVADEVSWLVPHALNLCINNMIPARVPRTLVFAMSH